MDSISQIVLGASMGEVVLGRKLGNKAMFWGALGGTIPDLDVIIGPFLSELDALIFHRGFSHSILFAILGGISAGWLIHRLHNSKYYKNFLWISMSLFIGCIPTSVLFFLSGHSEFKYYYVGASAILTLFIYIFLAKKKVPKLIRKNDNPSLSSWQLMFFLAFFTHAILDCFTIYGTQLFLPFSDYRVAFSTISVADPFGYTLPFLFCLFMAMRYNKTSLIRKRWAWAGIIISLFYLTFTIWNKNRVFREFDRQLAAQGIKYDRAVLNPYLFSNFLWSITVENEDKFYNASYSIFDKSPIYFLPITKNHHLIRDGNEDRTISKLKWFTNDFFSVQERPDGKIQINDLRYGTFRQQGDIKDFVFRFHLFKKSEGEYNLDATLGGSEEESASTLFRDLFFRIMGR